MPSTTYYRQCHLQAPTDKGTTEITTWLPERFAKLRQTLRLKQGKIWTEGWVVQFVGARCSEELLPDVRSQVRSHHRATGDSWR